MDHTAERIPIDIGYDVAVPRHVRVLLTTGEAITGHVVELDGDTAKIHAHVRAEHWLPAGTGPWLVVGFYDNEAVRTPDGWRLTRVKLTATYQENQHLSGVALSQA